MIRPLERPVIVIGNGVRASGADPRPLLELGVPVISSWQAADLVDNDHPAYYGRPGIYGQRCANRILHEADQVLSIGCRLTPWMIGHAGLRPDQELLLVEVDQFEAARFPNAKWIAGDAAEFIPTLGPIERPAWREQCDKYRSAYPWVEAAHADTEGYINSYRFIERLQPLLRPDETIVVDVGCLMCPPFQALRLNPPQRLITSGGLGEMGCALPMAIGASAPDKRQVICLVGDGGLMMNLQEIQTVLHHELPIKIIVFANDGYAMIKGTHKNLKMPYTGVNKASGVSMPNFMNLARGFGLHTPRAAIWSWADFDFVMPWFLSCKHPALVEVRIDPEQSYVPRLQPVIAPDGTITPARFDQLSPILG